VGGRPLAGTVWRRSWELGVGYDPLPMAVRLLALTFATIVAGLHVVRRDVSPLTRGVSRYASGWTTPAMTLAFLALAAAFGFVAWNARSWWFAIAAASMAGIAATPERLAPPHHSTPHTLCGFLFFVAAPVGIYSSPASSVWPAIAALLFLLSVARIPVLNRIPGLLQRICLLTIVVWLLSPFAGRS
jgi:uncharacterized protein DUF998